MNCTEFQEILPEVFEAGRTAEQAAHLKSCPRCSGLLADLDLIAREARQLQELAEPSPRVWNSIEIELRREGVIREAQGGPTLVAPRARPWNLGAWLAPVAALALVAFGIGLYQRGSLTGRRIVQPFDGAAAVDGHRSSPDIHPAGSEKPAR